MSWTIKKPREEVEETINTFIAMFNRRLRNGQTHGKPGSVIKETIPKSIVALYTTNVAKVMFQQMITLNERESTSHLTLGEEVIDISIRWNDDDTILMVWSNCVWGGLPCSNEEDHMHITS